MHATIGAFSSGVIGLDFRRSQQRFGDRPMAVVEASAMLAMGLSLVPAAVTFGDHRAMLVALIADAASYLLLSQLVATRTYRVRFNRAALMPNAVTLFLTFHADHLITARAYDWGTLALFGVALQVAFLPAQIVGRAAESLVPPQLRVALHGVRLDPIWPPLLGTHTLLGLGLTAGFALRAPSHIARVCGAAFRPEPALALAVGLARARRKWRVVTLVCLATLAAHWPPGRAATIPWASISTAGPSRRPSCRWSPSSLQPGSKC